MDAKVLDFLRCAIGCPNLEGYGQTECAGACTSNLLGDFTLEHAGAPLPSCSIKLIDVPEMNYYSTEEKGEILLKGPIVFKGYYLDNDKTDEIIDLDGWLHTGDIGQWNENGTLQIIDRKKDIFKLSHGEYIAPDKIEQIYSRSQYVQQMFAYGDSLKSCLVAIVVPKQEISKVFQMLNNINLKQKILEDFKKIGKNEYLNSIEQIKNIYIQNEEFSIVNGLLTPTLKNKKFALKKFFLNQLNELYENNF